MLIPFSQALDLRSTLESGQAFRWMPEDPLHGGRGQWYHGVIFDNVVKMRETPGGIEFFCGPDDELALEPLVRDYLRLLDDLEAIYGSMGLDDHISSAISRYRGMRVLRQDPWECLISFTCSSNSNTSRISANVEDMSRSLGHPIELNGHVRSTFPTPQDLAEAGEDHLRRLALGFHAKYVAAVAAKIANGDLDLFALREGSYEDALEALTALPGVGDKIASCVMLFSLDKPEAFPVDVWIDRALREWYLDAAGKKLSRPNMKLWAQEYFGPYAGYANQYLFHGQRIQGRKKTG